MVELRKLYAHFNGSVECIFSFIREQGHNGITHELVDETELTKVRNRLVTDQLRQLRSNSGLARLLTSYQSLGGDWRYLVTYATEIDKLSAEDIKEVANNYFTSANRTVVVLKREEASL